MSDILKSKFNIDTDMDTGIIRIEEAYACSVHISYLKTKEQAVKDSLISLGWIPPKDI
jgi:hypothetical protein